MQDQDRIRQRAYAIWEREGRPEGRHEEHWARAQQEIAAEGNQGGPPQPAASDDSPTLTAPDRSGANPAEAAAAAKAVGAPREAETPEQSSRAASPGKG